MRVSLNLIKQYTEVNLQTDELIERINTQLGGVEEVIYLGDRYKDAVIVRVVECSKHPNADKLSICLIDDGRVVNDVERNENGLIQVVCGAPNARSDMIAVWLPPGSVVPSSYEDKSPFKLSAREIRGVKSNGMLASSSELSISDDHSGIIDITEDDIKIQGSGFSSTPVEDLVGQGFAEVFGLDDVLIDIENKMFTHRPDLFGQLGVAREIAGIQGYRFSSPDWYSEPPVFSEGGDLSIEVLNDAPEKVSRFMAVAFKGVKVQPSPLWLQCELVRLGSKPINNVVDITNYVMLLTAQPVHAYDYDKLRGHKLGVRLAGVGETITLLNEKTYELSEDDIVIVDSEGAIGLAGIMGGLDTEVTSETTNIVLEVATFDMFAVRRTSMRHGLFTDALTRFNKGQSPLQTDRIVGLLTDLFGSIVGAEQASDVYGQVGDASHNKVATTSVDFINSRLGLKLTLDEIQQILENVEFSVDGDLTLTAPFWRTDIELPEDVVEEVGRLYGFDKLPRELPERSIKPTPKNEMRELKQAIRETLASAGANEVLTYSFVHENILTHSGQDPADSYRISNSLSPDLQYYRQSLTPSLLSHVHANIKAGYDSFVLFEQGKVHRKSFGLNSEGVPVQKHQMALTFGAKRSESGAAFYQAKQYLQVLAQEMSVQLDVRELAEHNAATATFEPKRSAEIVISKTGEIIGVVGEYRRPVASRFKLPRFSAGFELSLDALLGVRSELQHTYRPLSRYPSITRDVCFKVGDDISYADLLGAISIRHREGLSVDISPIDIYRDSAESSSKQITFRVRMTDHERTLASEDAEDIVSSITVSAAEAVKAEVV